MEDDSLPICPKSLPEQSRGRGKKAAKDDEQAAHLESFDISLLQELVNILHVLTAELYLSIGLNVLKFSAG